MLRQLSGVTERFSKFEQDRSASSSEIADITAGPVRRQRKLAPSQWPEL
jgi:hypothetical protein